VRRPDEPSGLYHTAARRRNCRNLHIIKKFRSSSRLTLFETGTYTQLMNARRVVAAVTACAAVLTAHTSAQTLQRSLYVSVVDDAGAPVAGLGPTDFIVREDNVAREVLRVAPADEPMQIAVLVDTSRTARQNISFMRSALPAFITALTNPNEAGRKNAVALIAFGERPTILTDYSSNAAELQKGVNRIWSLPDAGAYLLDALLEVCQGFKKREATRPVIVAIAVEGPELSYRNYDQVLAPLRDCSAPFYALMIGTPSTDLSDEGRSRAIVLDRGTSDTGGRRDQLLTGMALNDRLKQLGAQLTHQYRVTYARPQSLIPPERVTVTAARPGLTARGTPAKERQDRP
jgi:von Willebrand factor type A domain